MPDITFFEPPRIRPGYEEFTTYECSSSKSVRLGDWRFYQTNVKPINGPVCGGRWDLIGYEVTYTNPFISAQERDTLWAKYLEETGQAKK